MRKSYLFNGLGLWLNAFVVLRVTTEHQMLLYEYNAVRYYIHIHN
jgi:hypothetical protein